MSEKSLYAVPSGERVHIGFFGVRNAGKSSLVNALTNQALSIVSDTPGTTTDPVRKAMELLPLGPVVIIDTPGIDDEGALGAQRVEKTKETLRGIDVAVLVADGTRGLQEADRGLISLFEERKLPYILAFNKADLSEKEDRDKAAAVPGSPAERIRVSALTGEGVEELKELLGSFAKAAKKEKKILADLVKPGEAVVLVIPIDASAPKGRIILPQQMVLRELLDLHCRAICLQPEELPLLFGTPGQERKSSCAVSLVITDSQVFETVAKLVPETVRLTSFSILMARYKGSLAPFLKGAERLAGLNDDDRVLISEGCTHHRQCEDIGTKKLPDWIAAYCGARPQFYFTQGREFPEDLSEYALVVHCGGCMLGEAEMQGRVRAVRSAGVPIVNYGIAIAQMKGILPRAVSIF